MSYREASKLQLSLDISVNLKSVRLISIANIPSTMQMKNFLAFAARKKECFDGRQL